MPGEGRSPGIDSPQSANVVLQEDRSLPGPLAAISDYILENSQLPIFFGAVTSLALLGYHVSVRAESLREVTDQPLLNFRTSYTPKAVYDLFEDLGPEGRAEYQYINVLGTGAFPALVAICFAIVIGQTFRRAGLPYEWNLLPLVYLAVATAENLGIAYLLYTFPAVQPNAAGITGIFASFKFRLLTYNALSVVLGCAWLLKTLVQKRFAKKRN